MTIKLVTYLWAIAILGSIILLFIYAPIKVITKFIKGERFEKKKTYSFSKVIKFSIITAIVSAAISAIIYLETKSAELSLTLFVFFMACNVSGLIRTLVNQSHLKGQGAIKED